MDFALSQEQEQMRNAARAFAQEEIAPRARDNDRNCFFDRELVQKMADVGFLGSTVACAYGGQGASLVDYVLLVEEIGCACSSMRTTVSVQTSLVAKTIEQWGTDAQRREMLPKLCSAESLGCFGLTEPGSGSDPASMSTSAERNAGKWTLSGQKTLISLGTSADIALIFAKSDPTAAHRGVSCFLVPTSLPGFTSKPIRGKLGLKGSDTADLFLDDVVVDQDAILGPVGAGFKIAMTALDHGRLSVAAGCVGVARASIDASVEYARRREQFGRPIGTFQMVQGRIADMVAETDAARLLVWRAADRMDKGHEGTREISIAKLFASETAVRASNAAIEIHGGHGYIDAHPVERYMRDARVTTLYEGTSDIQRLIIGREATGLSAFS